MIDDIIERLRSRGASLVCWQAADEIERLRADLYSAEGEIAKLQAGIKRLLGKIAQLEDGD